MPTPNQISQALIAAMADNSGGFTDVAATSTALLGILKKKGRIKKYSGPLIEENVNYGRPGNGQWYRGYEFLNIDPSQELAKAEWVPKQLSVQAVINGREMVENMGETRLIDLFNLKISNAKAEAREMVYQGLHSDGTGFGGRQITGLKAMLPVDPTVGIYAGINRANWQWWRPGAYDISNGNIPGANVVNKDTILSIYRTVIRKHSMGTAGPDLILASEDHYTALEEKLDGIQRITKQGGAAELGFAAISINAGGRTVEVALEGGIGSEMPTGTSYVLDTDSLALRYHPERNWSTEDKKAPVNQDAIVAPVFWMGEMTMTNARFMAAIRN